MKSAFDGIRSTEAIKKNQGIKIFTNVLVCVSTDFFCVPALCAGW